MHYLDKIDWQSSEFAQMYDELPLWSAPFGRMLLERVPVSPGLKILDIGAGTGFLAIELAQRCGADSIVYAVDPWGAAIRRLREKLDQFGIKNVQTSVKDAASLDLPGGSIDLIVSNLGINNFDDPPAVLRTCFRLGRSGAKLFLTTNLVGHMAEFYDVYRAVLIENGLSHHLANLDAHIQHRATIASVQKELADAGFEMVKVDTGSFHERFAGGSALLRHYRIRASFVQGWKSIGPEDAAETVFSALETKLNEIARERGELCLTIPMACFEARKPTSL